MKQVLLIAHFVLFMLYIPKINAQYTMCLNYFGSSYNYTNYGTQFSIDTKLKNLKNQKDQNIGMRIASPILANFGSFVDLETYYNREIIDILNSNFFVFNLGASLGFMQDFNRETSNPHFTIDFNLNINFYNSDKMSVGWTGSVNPGFAYIIRNNYNNYLWRYASVTSGIKLSLFNSKKENKN